MYQSQQYLEIAGKFIVNPFHKDETMHGVCLHNLLSHLHQSGAKQMIDFKAILMSAIEVEIGLDDMQKVSAIYKNVMVKLSELGVSPEKTTH
ncbi:hypothetical protein RYZ26_01905 [Terasakiella sp. A23]|uniref:hypothetical protein n=1 Tax=Terasakiella sp. FCG-A23 TaxID=3080561 RepID=UPI00295577D4|nr:hypothetical protein [Terasakiella sp. A23]MDV7338332.1 hypothetical protein [Terasakiella sp. A23]